MKVTYCRITSWAGRVAGAEHQYVELHQKGGVEGKTLQHNLTLSEAERLNRRNPSERWAPGEEVNYFFDRGRAVRAAVEQYKLVYPDSVILVDGDPTTHQPQPILDGPPETMELINNLVELAEAIDWWEEDEPAMQVIQDAWKAIWHPEFEE